MKFIRKTLVMLCVFVLGYVISQRNFIKASENKEQYKIELTEMVVITRENSKPNYQEYIIIKDIDGNDVTESIQYHVHDDYVQYDKVGIYPFTITVYDEVNNFVVTKIPMIEVVKDKPPIIK